MKHIFVINPTAGKSDSRQRIYDMAEQLRRDHNLDVSCMLTRHAGHATQLARNLAQTGEELRIYACGGDGTANEVANGIAGFANASMTCIPIGTGNDMLKNFGTDAGRFSDPENLWNGPSFPLDLIDCNGRLCLTIACSGIDARVARDVHKYSSRPFLDGKGSYIASLAVNFLFKGITRHWTITLGEEVLQGEYAIVSVCNGRYYGGGFMPIGEARMNDGVLNTIVVKKVDRIQFAKFVTPYSKGEYTRFPDFARVYTVPEIRIDSDRCDITTCLDGECVDSDHVIIRLSDKHVNFFGPVGCDPNATARPDPAQGEAAGAAR